MQVEYSTRAKAFFHFERGLLLTHNEIVVAVGNKGITDVRRYI